MGQAYSYFLTESKRKLCDDIIDDIDFTLHITIHSIGITPDYSKLLEYLQSTNPILSYWYCKSIYLLYSPKQKYLNLRSNVSGDIISTLSGDITRYCLLNRVCDPYCVEVDIIAEPHKTAREALLLLIKNNLYYGKLHGIEILSEEKIREQFSII